jgi:endonuclease/exonuclease/phosphatase (EEP) superfamily protein YafD
MLQAVAAVAAAALYAAAWRRWKLGAILAVVAAGLALWPFVLGRRGDPVPEGPARAELTLVYANLYTRNGHHAEVVRRLLHGAPDVAGLLEVDSAWLESLEALRRELPHEITNPRRDNFGIALFSRYPITSGGLIGLTGGDHQIDVVLEGPTGPLRLMLAHPPPPVSRWGASENRSIHEELGRRAAEARHPLVLAGDFNATPWSPDLRGLIAAGGFQRPALASLRPTWPRTPLFPVLGIPIDHVLVRGRLRVSEMEHLALPGSDHLGIRVRLQLLGE